MKFHASPDTQRRHTRTLNKNNAQQEIILQIRKSQEALRRRPGNGIPGGPINNHPQRRPAMVPHRPRPSPQQHRRFRVANQRQGTSHPLSNHWQ
jgi:hypothetical protein